MIYFVSTVSATGFKPAVTTIEIGVIDNSGELNKINHIIINLLW